MSQISEGLFFLENVFDLKQWTWIGGEVVIPSGKDITAGTENKYDLQVNITPESGGNTRDLIEHYKEIWKVLEVKLEIT